MGRGGRDRRLLLRKGLFSGAAGPSPELVLIDRTAGTNIGDMTGGGGLAAAFDGTTNQAGAAGASKAATTVAFVGKTLAAERVFGEAVVYGSNNQGFVNNENGEVTLDVYGKDGAAPANSTDGTVLGTLTFTDTADESAGRTVESTDLVNAWDHLWVRISKVSGAGQQMNCAEVVLFAWEVPS